jgi:hypothetical protein
MAIFAVGGCFGALVMALWQGSSVEDRMDMSESVRESLRQETLNFHKDNRDGDPLPDIRMSNIEVKK